jgi:hypothetical protein
VIEVEVGGLREVLIGGRQMFGIGKINTFFVCTVICQIMYFLEEAINL